MQVKLLTAVISLTAIAISLWMLYSTREGLVITQTHLGTIPVTVFEPSSSKRAPVVVIAHGFAGSQQLMQPFAMTLARNGFVAVTFDFPGHGRNSAPLTGGLSNHDALGRALLDALDEVAVFAGKLPSSDGRFGLLGHSMASDIVVRYAQAHPTVEATVAVSLFFPGATADSPRNLLIIDGALEPAMLLKEAHRIVGMTAGGQATQRVTYGNFANGTARRLALASNVEHIGVLYSEESMAEALAWMNEAFGRHGTGFLDARGPWLGLLYLGLVALAWPLASMLPRVAPVPLGAGLRWHRLLVVAIVPALLTPLILWKMPTDFLPILLGDYLVLHFALYGLLTAAGMRIVGRSNRASASGVVSRSKLVVATLAATAYATLAFGLPTDWFVTSLAPATGRVPLILAMLCGTSLYFISDEWLTRGASGARGAYAATKICFLFSLVLAIGLNLNKLFFLVIIVPAILALFIVYGLLSSWVYRRTNHPLVGALTNAVAFAWAIAVIFPLVSR